jgi:hypothetical protein
MAKKECNSVCIVGVFCMNCNHLIGYSLGDSKHIRVNEMFNEMNESLGKKTVMLLCQECYNRLPAHGIWQ